MRRPIAPKHSTAPQTAAYVHVACAGWDKHDCHHLPKGGNWCTNSVTAEDEVSVGTETIAQIVSAYELTISCEKCGAQSQQTIGWIRLHRDMKCPGCDAVIVLNTSRITGTIRSVERRLGDLQTQLTERIRKL
jgi:hypothetical protein